MGKLQWFSLGIFATLLLIISLVFFRGLGRDPQALDLITQGKPMPSFQLPSLLTPETLTLADLQTESPYFLLNFWGSWCPACYEEHAFLMQLSKEHPLYGVNWKDEEAAAKQFLNDLGNPFARIVVDNHSELAIGMGVYGAPETFLISQSGQIIYRYAGPLDASLWQTHFAPKIAELRANKALTQSQPQSQ